ncbi:MAG: hypothetical protein JWN93_2529 [Hyphomicrobiales bacterium]|nr:hypothetical protein [Hyphomicrobiales bacterium]
MEVDGSTGALLGAFGALAALWAAYVRSPARGSAHPDVSGLRAEVARLKESLAAAERAEAANEAKTRFLATVSHEIRTPLNGILGMADLLANSGLAAEQRSYVEAIRTSGGALASLIGEILDLSRIEAGRLDLVEAPYDVVALVEGVAELLAPRAQDKGLSIAAHVASDVPRRLVGDSARIRQVLLNLAGNSIKFTDRGGVGIRIRRDGRLIFEVEDTGPGIAEEHRAAIFEDFEQVDGSLTRRHEGSGLGLAISRGIATRMGGSVTLARSGPDGSVFALEVPLRPAAPDIARPTLPEGSAELSGKSVLIVGRAPFEAPYLAQWLAAAGARARCAGEPAEAMDALREQPPPDVIVVDCALGAQAAQEIAGAARAAGVPRSLVLFSPFERRAISPLVLDAFDGWLVKPVRSASLIARVGLPPGAQDRLPAEDEAREHPPGGLHILLAEDNDINALVARKHLEHIGASVVRAVDGLEAVDFVRSVHSGARAPFDVILMDVRMPGLDGLEATRTIRRLERAAGVEPVRIVALTANAFEDDRLACFAAGVDDFLTKPFEAARLARAVRPQEIA